MEDVGVSVHCGVEVGAVGVELSLEFGGERGISFLLGLGRSECGGSYRVGLDLGDRLRNRHARTFLGLKRCEVLSR